MTTRIKGMNWGQATRDSDGHREYKLKVLVEGAVTDGAANAMQTPGLPVPYAVWSVAGDADVWAWCRWNVEVSPYLDSQPNRFWWLTYTFSTKPVEDRCRTLQVENPLLEPPKVTGSYTRYQEEATRDRFGVPITTSSWEQFRGPQVEFDASRMSVKIEMPVPALVSLLVAGMVDCVNQFPLWGMPKRSIKLNAPTWKRCYWGTCNVYYVYTFDFEVRVDPLTGLGGWDRDLLDEGTKVLQGHWDNATAGSPWIIDPIDNEGTKPDRYNPQHYRRFKDRQGENCKVILNFGSPAGVIIGGGEAKNEIQTLSGTGNTNGTFDLAWNGDTNLTLSLPYNATAEEIQTYLEGIQVPGGSFPLAGNVVVTGGPLDVQPIVIEFTNDLAAAQQPLLTPTASTVTPSSPTIAETQKGKPKGDQAPSDAGYVHVEKYSDANFALLGIPLSI